MATVSSMANMTSMMYKNGLGSYGTSSLFGSSSAKSSIWDNYYSASSASSSVLSGLVGISSSKAALLSSYNDAAKLFNTEFKSTINSLKDSTSALKSVDFSAVAKGEKDAMDAAAAEGVTASRTDAMTNALQTVKDFIGDYNDSITFLKENSEVSTRVKNLATSFGDTTYRAESLAKIGISVASDGTMTLDEEKLAKSITESPEQVSAILGKNGLAGKADSHVSFAQSQQSNLFPSVTSVLGSDFKNSAVYSGNSLLRISSYASMGNFLNMMA